MLTYSRVNLWFYGLQPIHESMSPILINHGLATELPTEAGDDDRVLDTAVLSMSVSSTFGCEITDFFRGFSEKIHENPV